MEGPAFPHLLRFALAESELGGALAVAGGEEHEIAVENGIGRIHPVLGEPANAPGLLARLEIYGEVRLLGSERRVPFALPLEGQGRGVAGILVGRFPNDGAGGFVERKSGFAHVEHEQILMHQRRPAEAPSRHSNAGIGGHVFVPQDFPIRGLKAEHFAPAVERVHSVVVEGGSTGGAAFEELVPQLGGEGVLPQELAGVGIEAPHGVLFVRVTRGDGASARDHKAAESEPHLGLPRDLGSIGRPVGEPLGFARNTVARRTAPLRPVVGLDGSQRIDRGGSDGHHPERRKRSAQRSHAMRGGNGGIRARRTRTRRRTRPAGRCRRRSSTSGFVASPPCRGWQGSRRAALRASQKRNAGCACGVARRKCW